ncbi:MAG: prepilin peptidase [Methanomicrobiales archaeon]|nr:prepilin peptidase [Methanomicrobiales archaeon]
MIIPLIITSLVVGITLLYASWLDIQDRRVPFRTWYPMLVIGIPFVVFFYANLVLVSPSLFLRFVVITALFCGFFYFFAAIHLFGGADAWALIFIAALIPVFPVQPFFDYSPLQFFPFTVLTNAVILNLATPLGIFIMNVGRKNFAPFPYMFFGFPVPGDRVEQYFGFVMEEINEHEGGLTRRFVTVRESLSTMVRGGDRLYTKDIRLHPEQYTKERALFKKAGYIWISYGVPFILPITAGFFTALLAGDILYTVMRMAIGV